MSTLPVRVTDWRKSRIQVGVLAMVAIVVGCSRAAPQREVDRPDQRAAGTPSEIQNNTEPQVFAGSERLPEPEAAAAPEHAPKQSPSPTLDELLLFFPAKYPSGDWQPERLVFEDIWFEAEDGTRLHGWYCPSERPRAVVLYAHGNAGNLSHRASVLATLQQRLRVTVLIFDYRGYGRSEGVPTVPGILQDARAARAALAERAGKEESAIVLMGRSLGGAVAVELAGDNPPRALILESTFSSLKDVAAHHYPRLSWLVPPAKLNSVARLARYKGPLLQSHGDADAAIPLRLGKKLFDVAPGRKTFLTISGGSHNAPQTDEFYEGLDAFFDELDE